MAAASAAEAVVLRDELDRNRFTTSVFHEGGSERSRSELEMEVLNEASAFARPA